MMRVAVLSQLLRWDLVVPDCAAVDAAAESLTSKGIKTIQQPTGIVATVAWGLTVRVLAG